MLDYSGLSTSHTRIALAYLATVNTPLAVYSSTTVYIFLGLIWLSLLWSWSDQSTCHRFPYEIFGVKKLILKKAKFTFGNDKQQSKNSLFLFISKKRFNWFVRSGRFVIALQYCCPPLWHTIIIMLFFYMHICTININILSGLKKKLNHFNNQIIFLV